MADDDLNPVVGIDLGTTFSSIARWNQKDGRPEAYRLADGSTSIPSIVYIQDGGTPLVGKFARQRLVIDPPNAVQKIKRYMGDDSKVISLRGKDYTPVDISAIILRRIKEDVEKRYPSTAGFDIAGAIITHPQYFKFPQIARTQQAAEAAGLPVLRLLAEPVAAALSYGFTTYHKLDEERSEKLMIFDLGGGTFDVTVLHVINTLNSITFRVLSVGGDDMLGGTNFDEDFAEWTLRTQNIKFDGVDKPTRDRSMAKLQEAIIEAKIQLSSMEDTFIAVPNILPEQHLDFEVTRSQFNEIIEPHVNRIRRIVSSTLAAAGLRAGELDRTILVGGSSYIPIMREIVREETGAEPWANADLELEVCMGAAFLAAMEYGRVDSRKEIIIEEVTSHALGVRAADDRFAVLIPANRAAPVEATKIFTTDSASFTVTPYQGNGKKVTEDGVKRLKDIQVTGVQLGPDGRADVKITFRVNEQQILYVKIEAPGVSEQRQLEF